MRPRLAVLLAVLGLLLIAEGPSHAQGLPTWDDKTLQAWWARNPTPDTWPKAADALKAQLEAAYKSDGARVFSDTDFQAGLDQYLWVELGLACPDQIADPAHLKTFVALGQD